MSSISFLTFSAVGFGYGLDLGSGTGRFEKKLEVLVQVSEGFEFLGAYILLILKDQVAI